MKIDSLDDLESAFAEWRRTKAHAREAVPEVLLARARRATKKHGVKGVVRVTRIERSRLFRGEPPKKRTKRGVRRRATFSRLELSAPAGGDRPVAEVETATGVKLRVFAVTPEMMRVLSAACGFGGDR